MDYLIYLIALKFNLLNKPIEDIVFYEMLAWAQNVWMKEQRIQSRARQLLAKKKGKDCRTGHLHDGKGGNKETNPPKHIVLEQMQKRPIHKATRNQKPERPIRLAPAPKPGLDIKVRSGKTYTVRIHDCRVIAWHRSIQQFDMCFYTSMGKRVFPVKYTLKDWPFVVILPKELHDPVWEAKIHKAMDHVPLMIYRADAHLRTYAWGSQALLHFERDTNAHIMRLDDVIAH